MKTAGVSKKYPDVFKTIILSGYTTWNIGGPCDAAFAASPEQLVRAVGILGDLHVPWTVLGRGSNTLAPSAGWNGAVVILAGEFRRCEFKGEELSAGGGASLPPMAGAACSKGLSGLVFAVGIPGTAGGAVYMNAGAYGSSMSDTVTEVTVFQPSGEFNTVHRSRCGFSYRSSVFQSDGSVVTGVRMKLARGSVPELRRRAVEILCLRRLKFPVSMPNAGSVFKRPDDGPPPGKLIEDSGLKGFSIGGAEVSRTHANFIVNRGGATSDDVLRLIETVRERVERDTGIELHREIEILGDK